MYTLTNEKKQFKDKTLTRLQFAVDVDGFKAGELSGFVDDINAIKNSVIGPDVIVCNSTIIDSVIIDKYVIVDSKIDSSKLHSIRKQSYVANSKIIKTSLYVGTITKRSTLYDVTSTEFLNIDKSKLSDVIAMNSSSETKSDVEEGNFKIPNQYYKTSNIRNSKIALSSLYLVDIFDSEVIDTVAVAAHIEKSEVIDALFEYCDAYKTILKGSNALYCSLKESNIRQSVVESSEIVSSQLDFSNIDSTNIVDCKINHSKIENTTIASLRMFSANICNNKYINILLRKRRYFVYMSVNNQLMVKVDNQVQSFENFDKTQEPILLQLIDSIFNIVK